MTTRSEPGHGQPHPGLGAIISERRQLINVAYRLLGSLAETEDAVQETYARWYALSRHQQDAIESPGAWLTTVEPLPEPMEWIRPASQTGHQPFARPVPGCRTAA
jgi:hypothetical protein